MNQQLLIFIGICILAASTYAIRFAGLTLTQHFILSRQQEQRLSDAATTLLFAIAVLGTLFSGSEWAGLSRLLGVGAALYLIWKNYSLLSIMAAAAGITALSRFCGFS